MALLVMSPILRKLAAACHKQVAAFRLCQSDAEWIRPKALTWCLPATVPPPYGNGGARINHRETAFAGRVASGATQLAERGAFLYGDDKIVLAMHHQRRRGDLASGQTEAKTGPS
jgi:hypothetical protein